VDRFVLTPFFNTHACLQQLLIAPTQRSLSSTSVIFLVFLAGRRLAPERASNPQLPPVRDTFRQPRLPALRGAIIRLNGTSVPRQVNECRQLGHCARGIEGGDGRIRMRFKRIRRNIFASNLLDADKRPLPRTLSKHSSPLFLTCWWHRFTMVPGRCEATRTVIFVAICR